MADVADLQLNVDSSQVRRATEDNKRFAEQTEKTTSAVEQGMRAAEREILAKREAQRASIEHARNEEAFRMSMEQTSSVSSEVRLHFEELRLEYEKGNITQQEYADTLAGMQQRMGGLDNQTIESVRTARMLNTELNVLGGEAESTSGSMRGTRSVMNTMASTIGSLASGSGNLSSQLGSLTRNLGFMTQQAGGAGVAVKQLAAFILTSGGLAVAVGVAIPLVIRLTKAMMDKGDEAHTAEEKVESLNGVIDNYIGTLTRLNSIEIYNPLGTITSQSNLENLQNLQEHLQGFFDLQQEMERATSQTRAFGAPVGGTIPVQSVELAQALREEYEQMRGTLGALADTDREYLEEKQRGIELEIAYQQALINTNSILRLQHDITQEVSGTLRDHTLGLVGSEEALTSLLDKYQGLAQVLTEQDRQYAGQGESLGVIRSLTEEQRKELEVYTEVIDRINRALGNTESTDIVAGSVGHLRSQISALNESIAGATSTGEIERYRTQIAGLEYEIDKLMGTLERPTTAMESPVDEILDGITSLNEIVAEMDALDTPIFDRYIPPESLRAKMIELQRLNIELDYAFNNEDRERLRGQIEEATKEINQMRGATETVNNAARDLGMTFSSAFEEAIMSGNSLRGVLAGLLDDINRIILRQKVTEPLAGGISNVLSGNSFFGSVESVNDALITSDGNVVKFHPDDDILAMKDLGSLNTGGNKVNVTVINNGDSEVEVQQRENSDGSIDISLMIERTMRDSFNSGRMDGTLSQFGVSRSGRRRG